jgi:hypothetical protein
MGGLDLMLRDSSLARENRRLTNMAADSNDAVRAYRI